MIWIDTCKNEVCIYEWQAIKCLRSYHRWRVRRASWRNMWRPQTPPRLTPCSGRFLKGRYVNLVGTFRNIRIIKYHFYTWTLIFCPLWIVHLRMRSQLFGHVLILEPMPTQQNSRLTDSLPTKITRTLYLKHIIMKIMFYKHLSTLPLQSLEWNWLQKQWWDCTAW